MEAGADPGDEGKQHSMRHGGSLGFGHARHSKMLPRNAATVGKQFLFSARSSTDRATGFYPVG